MYGQKVENQSGCENKTDISKYTAEKDKNKDWDATEREKYSEDRNKSKELTI